MIYLTEVKMTEMGPKTAADLLEFNWEKNRPISLPHVKRLASEMNKGRFDIGSIDMVTCEWNNEQVIVNGQHTLEAIRLSKKKIPVSVRLLNAEKKEDLKNYYARQDIGKKRLVTAISGAFEIEKNYGIHSGFIQRSASAIRFIESNFSKTHAQAMIEDDINRIIAWNKEILEYQTMYEGVTLRGRTKSKFRNLSVLSVALVLLRHCKNGPLVFNFWNGVLGGESYGPGDPRAMLRDRIMVTKITSASSSVDRKSAYYMSRLCAVAWNAFYNGETRKILTVSNERSPMRLLGTKYYTGKQSIKIKLSY